MVRRTGMPLIHLIHTIIPDLIRGRLSASPAIKERSTQTDCVPREGKPWDISKVEKERSMGGKEDKQAHVVNWTGNSNLKCC